jgi:hypothetical protein
MAKLLVKQEAKNSTFLTQKKRGLEALGLL